jgi:hypothetical protein
MYIFLFEISLGAANDSSQIDYLALELAHRNPEDP